MLHSSQMLAVLLWLVGQLFAATVVHSQWTFPGTSPSPVQAETRVQERSLSTAEIVPEIVVTEQKLAAIQDRLKNLADLPPIDAMLSEQDAILVQLQNYLKDNPVSSMTPGRFDESRSALLRFHSQSNRWQVILQKRVRNLDNNNLSLQQMSTLWEKTRQEVNDRSTPNALIRQIDQLLSDVHSLEDETLNQMGSLLELQSRVGKRLTQISMQLEILQREEMRVRDALLGFDHPPLWSLPFSDRQRGSMRTELSALIRIELNDLHIYWQTSGDSIKRQLTFFVFLSVFLLILYRRRVLRLVATVESTAAMHLISKPIPAAMLIALLTTRWWQPQAPQSIRELASLLSAFPVTYLLIGLINRQLMTAVLSVQGLIVLNVLRNFAIAGSALDRMILLSMGLLLLLALIPMLRAPSMDFDRLGIHPGKLSRSLLKLGLMLTTAALLFNIFGNFNLAEILTRGMFVATLLMVWLPLAYLVVKAILEFMLTSRVAMKFRTIQSHGTLIYTRVCFGLRALVIGTWIIFVVRYFSIEWIWEVYWQSLQWELRIGSLTLSPTNVVLFVLILWATMLLARFVRFVLEQEILSRVALERGLPTAISRLIHYALVGIGVFIASSAAGLSFSQFAIITGALSVGVGFGLQNIVNNFISGLILMVERPVDVGDTVELGALIGQVRIIGLRSSVVRTTTGAEVIVPNSHFIANEVINWTLSDQHRRIEIPVGVAYGTDPHAVIAALMAAAKDKKGVLSVPEPVVLFDGFGDNSLNFQIRFWTPEFQGWRVIRSAVALAIHDELKNAGIVIPFPQRDLHLRSVDDVVRQELDKLPRNQSPPSP